MNVLKNFEALFVVTLGLACAANYVLDQPQASAPAVAHAAGTANAASLAAPLAMSTQVVVVSAKRLSAAEKKQSLIDERRAALASSAVTGKM